MVRLASVALLALARRRASCWQAGPIRHLAVGIVAYPCAVAACDALEPAPLPARNSLWPSGCADWAVKFEQSAQRSRGNDRPICLSTSRTGLDSLVISSREMPSALPAFLDGHRRLNLDWGALAGTSEE